MLIKRFKLNSSLFFTIINDVSLDSITICTIICQTEMSSQVDLIIVIDYVAFLFDIVKSIKNALNPKQLFFLQMTF